jgi:hypothetical protein
MRHRIPPEALAVWLVLREIANDPTDRDEPEPVGRHREYINLTSSSAVFWASRPTS